MVPSVLFFMVLIVVLNTSWSKGSLFPANLPQRCPSKCRCDLDEYNRKRVLCENKELKTIPTDQMDIETEVIMFLGAPEDPNHVTLGRIFLELISLQEIHIKYSSLPLIGDSSFWPGKRLSLLDLSSNSIKMIRDTDFNGLINLKTLNLSENNLSSSPSAPFHHLQNLTTLSLRKNKFTKLEPRFFYKLSKLELLDFSENPLKELNDNDFSDIQKLKYLYLSDCELRILTPDVFKSLTNLIELNMNHNYIEYISDKTFTYSKSLKILLLDQNKLTTLSDYSFNGLQLNLLSISKNRLRQLTSCIFCNSSIEHLNISYNEFEYFEEECLNPLSESLTSLRIDNNVELTDPSLSFGTIIRNLKNIQFLNLSNTFLDNRIFKRNYFENLNKLIHLDISHNKLSNLSSNMFVNLTKLEKLDLSSNQMQGINQLVLEQLDSVSTLTQLYLHNNPWSCKKCHILPLIDWINSSPSAYFNVCKHRFGKVVKELDFCIKCAKPSQLDGRYLHLITEYDLFYCYDPTIKLRLTSSEPRVGLFLGLIIIVSLFLLILVIIVVYKKKGNVYYTHEQEQCKDTIKDIQPNRQTFQIKSGLEIAGSTAIHPTFVQIKNQRTSYSSSTNSEYGPESYPKTRF